MGGGFQEDVGFREGCDMELGVILRLCRVAHENSHYSLVQLFSCRSEAHKKMLDYDGIYNLKYLWEATASGNDVQSSLSSESS